MRSKADAGHRDFPIALIHPVVKGAPKPPRSKARASVGVIRMGIINGVINGASEKVVSGLLCGYLRRYAGPQCANLKTAIANRTDIYQLWVENAGREGIHGLREARFWSHKFPKVQYMVTPNNVKRWLRQEGLVDIVRTVESTPGGEQWLAWQLDRFRAGLWGR